MTVPDSVPAGQGTSSAPLDWHAPTRNLHLPLAAHTRDFGAACLRITPDDDWHTDAPLWLIENQALFDRTDWLPPGPAVKLLYYNGQLSDLARWYIGGILAGYVAAWFTGLNVPAWLRGLMPVVIIPLGTTLAVGAAA